MRLKRRDEVPFKGSYSTISSGHGINLIFLKDSLESVDYVFHYGNHPGDMNVLWLSSVYSNKISFIFDEVARIYYQWPTVWAVSPSGLSVSGQRPALIIKNQTS